MLFNESTYKFCWENDCNLIKPYTFIVICFRALMEHVYIPNIDLEKVGAVNQGLVSPFHAHIHKKLLMKLKLMNSYFP